LLVEAGVYGERNQKGRRSPKLINLLYFTPNSLQASAAGQVNFSVYNALKEASTIETKEQHFY